MKTTGFFLMSIIFCFYQNSLAFQCAEVDMQKRYDNAKFIFIAKVTSKTQEYAKVSIEKVYKGKPGDEVKISFPSSISKQYMLLHSLKEDQSYIFSSTREAKTNLIEISHCGLYFPTSNSKEKIDWLESKTPGW